MGNPSGCAPVQSPMPLPNGSSWHRQSLSISSLPLDKLERINCEKRMSVSALSSPVKVALTDSEKLSIATFLGHGQAKHQDFARRKVPSGTEELYLKGIELATGDRKPISFYPFRGHRRVSSGSFTPTCKSASEYSPRARSGSTSTFSPKKLDKYTVAKIAASLFHPPTKLERSMSLSRVAYRSAPDVVEKGNHGPSRAVGEVILPANLELSPFVQEKPQFTESADVEDVGKRSSSSDSDLAMDIEEPSSQHIANASSMQQNIIDITEMLECEGEGEAEQVEQPVTVAVEDPPLTTEDITSEFPSPHSQVSLNAAENYTNIVDEGDSAPDDVLSSPSSSQSSCMTSTETGIQLPSTGSPTLLESQEIGHESPEYIAALFEDATVEEESKDIAADDNLQLLRLATEEVPEDTELTETTVRCSASSEGDDPTAAISTDSEDESLPIPLTGSIKERDTNIQVPEKKLIVRKRRRSVSASGIGAMLLKVVRVSDSAQMVTRRMPKAGSPPELILFGVEALRARKYVLEKTAQISMGPAHEESALISSAKSTPVHACQTESEDAIKSTYSRFVDIEIDPGGDCIELVQNSKDAQDSTGYGVASNFETRQRNQQPTPGTCPRHLRDHESSICTAHQRILNDKFDTQTKVSTFASSNTQTADDRHGERPSKEPTSRARINPSDIGSLKECLKTVKTANSDNDGLDQAYTTISSSNQVPTSTRERSRIIVSRLQAPTSGAFSRVDVYRPCSTVSILANPSSSSSHQDKLWEEQAEIYSSGGRGTPGRDDEATTADVIINLRKSPSPATFVTDSCADHEVNPSLRRAGVVESSGKKRGRPNTPLRSLMDDHRRRASPESGHFIQQIMSRIRGSNSPKASVFPKSSSQLAIEKRRNPWSSCICFSVK